MWHNLSMLNKKEEEQFFFVNNRYISMLSASCVSNAFEGCSPSVSFYVLFWKLMLCI